MNESKKLNKKKLSVPPNPLSGNNRYINGNKRTLKSYLFDFFMLFLAVFCGYLAQWQLERSGENQKERQFIQSLAEDLKKDTLMIKNYINFNQNISYYCDSLQSCIANANIFKSSDSFYNYSKELARYMRYYPTDRTIQQLKNSGNMRLIRKMSVSNAITDYDIKTKLLIEFDQQLNGQIIKYREYLIAFLDLLKYDKVNPSGSFMANNIRTKGNPGFIIDDPARAKLIYNQAFTLKTFLSIVKNSSDEVNANAKKLLTLLQKEYNLSDRI
jgi:hypothetical protein